jgi:hypothetical protein
MPPTLPAGEPEAGPWRRVPVSTLLDLLVAIVGTPAGRPRIVAVDGRGASGKSTLADRLHRAAPRSAVVHTDDLAWHEPLFGWGHLLADHVLRPLHRGGGLSYRPPQWDVRGRRGSLEIPADTSLVIVEGTGASQRAHRDLVDATVWVQADVVEAERRGIARDIATGVNGSPAEAVAFWHAWMAEELAFLDRERPWCRADVIVSGTGSVDPDADLIGIAPPLDGAR